MVFGLCGGLQMLGTSLHDPQGLEGESSSQALQGLGLLPLHTWFGPTKTLRQRQSVALWPPGPPLEIGGFELHHGVSEAEAASLALEPGLGWWQAFGDQGGMVAGTYLHGVFEEGPWRRRWLNLLRARRTLPPLSEHQPHHGRQREALLDRLADAFEAHVNLEPLLQRHPG
jgi:adenosylcobyric acid synthase